MGALRKVLVVDDDPVVGRSFDRVLSGRGYVVATAENGLDALERIGKDDFDVVFTDIKMPGMSGLEVAEQVKAKRPWIPVVIVTGYGSDEHEARAEAAGVAGFLHKPLSPDLIEYSARMALRAKQQPPAQAATEAPQVPVASAPAAVFLARLKNVALFVASPFVGLAYILMFPFVGLAMLGWFGVKAVIRRPEKE